MKKLNIFIIIFLIFFIFILFFYFINSFKSLYSTNKKTLKSGKTAIDFIIGIKNEKIYHLKDFFNKKVIILVLLNNSFSSLKVQNIFNKKLKNIIFSNKNIIWFEILEAPNSLIINEKTNFLKTTFKENINKFPDEYKNLMKPSIIIINKYGIVQLIYSGYSPTLYKDIKKAIFEVLPNEK